MAAVNYPTGHEPRRRPVAGAHPCHDERLVRGHAVGHGPRPGAQDRHRADRGRDARRRVRGDRASRPPTPTRGRTTWARSPAGPRTGSATRSSRPPRGAPVAARGRGGGARGGRRRARASTATATSMVKGVPARSVKIAEIASLAQFKYGRTIAGRGVFMKPKSPGRSRDRRHGPRLDRGARLHGRRGRGRHRDRRGHRPEHPQRLRGRPPGQPGAGPGPDRGRRLDGHVARAVRDDRAVLPVARPQPQGLQRVPHAWPAGSSPRSSPSSSRCRPRTARTASRASAR